LFYLSYITAKVYKSLFTFKILSIKMEEIKLIILSKSIDFVGLNYLFKKC